MDEYLNSFREMISLRGLTDHTLTSYTTYIKAYLEYLSTILHKCPEDVTWDELRDFVRWIQNKRNLSDRTVNICIAQLRFFTLYVLHKPWDDTQLPRRKFDEYLPYVPTQSEVWEFISTMPHLKAKAMLAVMYSAGLRVGEVCNLKYEDISRKNMQIHIRHSKNRMDRYATLSKVALNILTEYWLTCGRPTEYLFPQKTDFHRPLYSYYLHWHIKAHEKKLGWPDRISCHTFRHAFGTHLYENGTDLLTIKALMGHRSLNSTTIYVHLGRNLTQKVVNPFDQIGAHYGEY